MFNHPGLLAASIVLSALLTFVAFNYFPNLNSGHSDKIPSPPQKVKTMTQLPLPASPSASLVASPSPEINKITAATSSSRVLAVSTISAVPPKPVPPSQFDGIFLEKAKEYGVDKELLRRIANCETHFNPGVANGPYGGMFQFTEDTWRATRQEMGADPDPHLRFGIKESIETAAWKISHGGVGAWLNCSK